MSYASYLNILLFVLAVFYTLCGFLSFAEPWSFISPLSFFLIALYCFLIAYLINISRGLQRGFVVLASIAIVLMYLLRFTVIVIMPELFGLGPNVLGYYDYLLKPEYINKSLSFMIMCTLALYCGLEFGFSRNKLKIQQNKIMSFPTTAKFSFFNYRNFIIILSFITMLINFTLSFVYHEGLSALKEGQLGYLLRLFPLDILLIVNIYLLLRYGKLLNTREKVFYIGYIVLFIILGVLRGQRGAMVATLFSFLAVGSFLFKDMLIKVRHFLLFIIVGISTFLLLMIIAWSIRDVWSSYGALDMGMVGESYIHFRSFGILSQFLDVSYRLNGFDRLLVVMNYQPSGIEAYTTITYFLGSIIDMICPDAIYSSNFWPMSKIFAVYYMDVDPSLKMGSGWGIFGAAFGYFGWLSLIIFLISGFIIAKLASICQHSNQEIMALLCVILIQKLYFNSMFGGAPDMAIAESFTGMIIVIFFVAIFHIVYWSVHNIGIAQLNRCIKRIYS